MFRTVLDPARPNLFVDGASALLGLTERSAFSVLGPRRPPSPVRGNPPCVQGRVHRIPDRPVAEPFPEASVAGRRRRPACGTFLKIKGGT